MKYTWEQQDIIVGRRVSSHNRAENYIIVYTVGTGLDRYGCASLEDGMIWLAATKTRAEVAAEFNKAGMRPDSVDTSDAKGEQP